MPKTLHKNLPDSPGVYLMKGTRGKVLYVGKAGNLRRRVSSYFMKAHDSKIERLLGEIKKINYQKTDTAIEALILESQLIKKYEPPYNAREKDDKSFLYVEVTKEKFPRVLLVRGKQLKAGLSRGARRAEWGPFTSATSIREALRIIRKIFPFHVHPPEKVGKFNRACFEYEIGLCPGTCVGLINRTDYLKNIRNIKLLLQGKKRLLLKKLESEMKAASRQLEFEKAEKLRRQIFALRHIRDVALLSEENPQFPGIKSQRIEGPALSRVEGYDISNISGTSAVGSMVVFQNGKPNTDEYRKFKISTITSSNDVGMIKEVLRRRFKNPWPYPSLILIDGGRGQVNAAKGVLNEFGLDLPVAGIAKGPSRKKNDFFGYKLTKREKEILVKVRDEAHRFALSYHRKVRNARFIGV